MSVQKWQGDFNGRVYDVRSVTVVGNADNLVLGEEKGASKLNKRDKLMVSQLQEWWAKEGKEKQSQSQSEDPRGESEKELKICDIVPSNKVFNSTCTVLEQVTTKIPRCKILRVSDNTKSTIPIIFLDKDGFTLKQEVGRDVYDIFVSEHLDLLRLAKPGKLVNLTGLQCVKSQKEGEDDGYKIVINSQADANCRVISNAANKPQNQILTNVSQDSEFDRMFANAMQLPNTEDISTEMTEKHALEDSNLTDGLEKGKIVATSRIDNEGKDNDSESIHVPIFSVNSEPFVIRPCTSTDNSTSMDDENENQAQISKRLEKQWPAKR